MNKSNNISSFMGSFGDLGRPSDLNEDKVVCHQEEEKMAIQQLIGQTMGNGTDLSRISYAQALHDQSRQVDTRNQSTLIPGSTSQSKLQSKITYYALGAQHQGSTENTTQKSSSKLSKARSPGKKKPSGSRAAHEIKASKKMKAEDRPKKKSKEESDILMESQSASFNQGDNLRIVGPNPSFGVMDRLIKEPANMHHHQATTNRPEESKISSKPKLRVQGQTSKLENEYQQFVSAASTSGPKSSKNVKRKAGSPQPTTEVRLFQTELRTSKPKALKAGPSLKLGSHTFKTKMKQIMVEKTHLRLKGKVAGCKSPTVLEPRKLESLIVSKRPTAKGRLDSAKSEGPKRKASPKTGSKTVMGMPTHVYGQAGSNSK